MIPWQEIAVLLLVAGAIVYLARRWWRRRRQGALCGDCRTCGAAGDGERPPLVQLSRNEQEDSAR